MAHIHMTMTAIGGIAAETCDGCVRLFERGETMFAVRYENEEPAGWFCLGCVNYWKANGRPPGCKEGQNDEASDEAQ